MLVTVILTVVSYVSMGLVGNWDPFARKMPKGSVEEALLPGRTEKIQEKPVTRNSRKTFTVKQEDVHPGKVIVKFTEEASVKVAAKTGKSGMVQTRSASSKLRIGLPTVDERLEPMRATEMKRVFPYHPKYEARQRANGLHLWYEITIDTTARLADVCRELEQDGNIQIAEPLLKKEFKDINGKKQKGERKTQLNQVVIMPLLDGGNMSMLPTRASRTPLSASTRSYEDTPPVNDPMLLQQWHYYNYGQVKNPAGMGSTPGADIKLFDAWKITMGDPRVIVSVHDQGVQFDHPDLAANMWVNQAEKNGRVGVDDDNNGYIDDIYGYNFASSTSQISPGEHGSHVAGTISAVNNNGVGVAGIAGGSGKGDGARIMGCQVFMGDASAGFAQSYVYAANNGAVISQNSWGHTKPDYYEQAILDAIDYFIEYAGKDENGNPLPNTPMVGGLVVFASGNEGIDGKCYPGYYEPCLAVSATGPWNDKPAYTNFGSWVDISAPGGSSADNGTEAAGVLSTVDGGKYSYFQGTSMACPHVSGVAALVLSAYGHEAYTPAMLKNRLLAGVTKWSEIGKDEYIVNMGAGLLNAAKAVAPDNAIAPDAITDLKVESIGYEFVRVTFKAPKDKDNGGATSYELRYSADSMSATCFSKGTALFQTAKAPGQMEEIIIDRLKGFTKYYIAVKGVDIWGNTADISNIVEATTLDAPAITTAPDSMEITVANAATVSGEGILQIGNTQGGDLRYAINYAIQKEPNSQSEKFTNFIYNYDPYAANMKNLSFGSNGEERFLSASRFVVKGKEGFSLTTVSAAIKAAYVDPETNKPIGWVSTPFHMKVYKGGNTPAEGKLMYNAKYSISFKDYYLQGEGADLGYQLSTTLRFDEGESFWVVFDFEKGFYNPMVVNDNTNSLSGGELYSVNDTTWADINTIAIKDTRPKFAYRVFALSTQNRLPENLIAFEPVEGFVKAGETKPVKVKVNAQKVEEGDYTSVLFISHNDPKKPVVQIPLRFTVDGHNPGIRSEKILSLGNVVQGYSETRKLELYNDSLGILEISTITCDKKQFTVKPDKDIKLLPGDTAVLEVTFRAPGVGAGGITSPDSVGVFLSKLNFNTNRAEGAYSVVLDAVSIERPIATLPEKSKDIELRMGERKEVSFVLKNDGKYRLDYRVEQDKTTDFDFEDCKPNVNQYYGKRTFENWTRLPVPGPRNKVQDITKQVKGLRNAVIPLPFTINYYGVNYDTITIAGNGNIHMGRRPDFLDNSSSIGRWAIPATIFPCTQTNDAMVTAQGGLAYVLVEGDKVTVEYTKFGEISGGVECENIRIQVVIFATGQVELKYTGFAPKPKGEGNLAGLIGMSDNTTSGGVGVWLNHYDKKNPKYYITGSTYLYGAEEMMIITQGNKKDTVYYKWTPPVIEYRKNTVIRLIPEVIFAKDITPESGHLMPGEEVTIKVKVGTDKNLKEGKYIRTIPIFTNDPENKEVPFKLNIDFKSDAKPALGQTELNFGKVGKNVTVTKSVLLRNLGGKAFKATGRMSDGTFFSVTPAVETDCGGLSAMEYDISFTPTEEKAYTDRLIIDIKDGDPLTLDVKGEGTKAPRLEVVKSADKFAFEVDLRKAGAHYVDTVLTVRNIGEAPLDYNLMSTEWIKDMTPALMSGMDKSGYYWSDNQTDASGVNYEWIEENPIPYNPLGRIDGLLYFSKEFELPWEFEYYGEKFTKCYTDMSGMISFHRDDILYHPMMANAIEAANLTIPHAGMCNGFIAGIGGSFDNSKHWYEVVGEGDDAKIVFTWKNRPLFDAITAQDTNTVTFQTILYKDGSIKFQYKDVEKAWWRNRTVIGIENRQGTDGLNICSNESKYIKNGLAIFIKPSRMKTLKPGEEKTYRLRADATNMWELNDANGKTLTHTGHILINSNDPSNPQNLTAVSMKVLGEAKAEFFVDGEVLADTLAFGKVYKSHYPFKHQIEVQSDSSLRYVTNSLKYTQKVTVKNTGSKTMKIHSEKQSTFYGLSSILSDEFGYTPISPSTAIYVEIPPSQSYTMNLTVNPTHISLNPAIQSAPDSGFYVLHYPLTEKCEAGDSATCRKLGYPNHMFFTNWMGTQYSYSYKVNIIPVSFDIYDVPQEKIVSEKPVQEIIFDARQGSESFAFEMKNEVLEDKSFWNTMHQLNGTGQEKGEIVKQSELDYELEIENLTKKEFNDLRSKKEAKVETSFVTAVKLGVAPVLTEQRQSIPFVSATTRPTTRTEAGEFLDSLGYFSHDGRVGGFTSGKQGVSVIYYIRYKAGAEGFNLTHFTTGVAKFKNAPEDGYEVKVRVLQGRDARTADVIHSEAFTPELVNFSEFATVEHRLEKNVYIYPNEYFWVSLETTFNTSIDMWGWKGSINYMHGLEQNFMIEFMGSFDLAVVMTGQYVAPSVVLYSDDQEKEVKNWIEVSKNTGNVKVGTSDRITVTVNPENDRTGMTTRYARIRVKSNDTYPFGVDSTLRCGWYFKNSAAGGKDSVNFDAYVRNRDEVLVMMRMNQAPEFTMENKTITLSEMQDSTVIVYVKDIEGDQFDDLQVVLDSSVFRQPAYGVSPVTGLKKVEAKGDTTCFAFTVKPGYESEGTHVYSFTTKDAKGNNAKCTVTVIVTNKNRVPEIIGANAMILQKEIYKHVNLNTLFSDPDRQSLAYTVEALNMEIATANVLDSTLTLFGWQAGEAELKLTATDPEGAVKAVVFKLTVIEENPSLKSAEVTIYPNPVVEIMNCGFSLNKHASVEFRIFNADGRLFYESKKLPYSPGKHEEKINVNSLPGGLFILQYMVNGVVKDTQKFIK